MQARENSVFGNTYTRSEAGLKHLCKSVMTKAAGANSQIPACPRCRSKNTWRNGHRSPLFGKPIQRWICRDCGSRFSDPVDVDRAKKELKEQEFIESKELKRSSALSINCQIRDEETKNLVTELFAQQKLVVPQKEAHDEKDNRGAVVNFVFWCQQNEKAPTTVTGYGYSLDYLVSNGANLFDPFSVKEVVTLKLKDKTKTRKYNLVKAYRAFAAAYEMDIASAKIPKYKPERKDPYLPPEAYMDALIAYCHGEMSALLQTFKETAARPVEVMRILWDKSTLYSSK